MPEDNFLLHLVLPSPLSLMLPILRRGRHYWVLSCTAPLSSMHSMTAVTVFAHVVMQTGELKKKLEEVKKQMGIEE